MSRVVHFEITANEPGKIIDFYRNVFDWEITEWSGPEDYWLVSTGDPDLPGINGGIFKPKEEFSGTVNTIEVIDLEDYLDRVRSNGGEVVTDIMEIESVGRFAYCRDTEGTLFGIMQPAIPE